MFFTIFCIVIVIASVIYKYTKLLNYWKTRKIPYEKPSPLFGNYLRIFFDKRGIMSMFDMYKNFADERFYGTIRLFYPEFVVKDLDLIKNILIKDFGHFPARNKDEKVMESQPLTQNLFNLHGNLWKKTRKKLHPIFTSSKLKDMFPLILEKGELNAKLLAARNCDLPEGVHIRDLVSNLFIDVIGSCCFGIESNAMTDSNSIFKKMCFKSTEITVYKMIVFFLENSLPRIVSLLRLRLFSLEIENFFYSIVKTSVNHRKDVNVKRNDVIDMLLELKDGDKKEVDDINVDLNFMTVQALMIFLAGLDTSSTVATFTLHSLAYNPGVQRKLHEEIDRTLAENDGHLTYSSLIKMTYMNMVINETMRMYPPSPFLQRMCRIPYKVSGTDYVIEKGTLIVIPLYGIHNDPKYFDKPEKFIPERFSPENKQNLQQMSILSFGDGPRHCIGKRLAVMQIIVGLVSILRDHTVEPCNKSTKEPVLNYGPLLLRSRDDIWLKLVKRQQLI